MAGKLKAWATDITTKFAANFFVPKTVYIHDADAQIAAASMSTPSSGNPYRTYDSATRAAARMYEGTAQYGGDIMRTIVNMRAALTIGDGISIMNGDSTGDAEFDFIKAWIVDVNLDGERAIQLAREAELEGQMLVEVVVGEDEAAGMALKHDPWTSLGYHVETDPESYEIVKEIWWEDSRMEKHTIDLGTSQYMSFGGRASAQPISTAAACGYLAENLDRATDDLRHINRLFSHPTPHFECADAASAENLYHSLVDRNWKVGQALATDAKLSFPAPAVNSAEVLEREIVRLVKRLSSATGIPVHFFGDTDLMSNRSTADNLMEMVVAATREERSAWKGFYEELFRLVLKLARDNWHLALDPEKSVEVEIPPVGPIRMQEVEKTWFPMWEAGAITLRTLLGKVPGIDDVEKELEAVEEEKAKAMEDFQGRALSLGGGDGAADGGTDTPTDASRSLASNPSTDSASTTGGRAPNAK